MHIENPNLLKKKFFFEDWDFFFKIWQKKSHLNSIGDGDEKMAPENTKKNL